MKLVFPFSDDGWLYLTALQSADEFRTFGGLLATLHSGEASCLTAAYHRNWVFLSDDMAARKAGQSLKIQISGTLGILLSLREMLINVAR